MNLPDAVKEEISRVAKRYGIEKVILFGSRARGDNRERSDVDIAVAGGDVTRFTVDIADSDATLLMFDVVNLDNDVSQELLEEIKKDGIVVYEKV